jgi:enoyl-CoA hydratase/carnithine racemase
MDMPVLAAVNGLAIGVGLTLLLHCDLVFASEAATFSAPFTRLGVVPEAGSSLLLPQAMGKAWATDLLLTGRVLSADEALTAGLVSRVTAHDDLRGLARDVAGALAARAPNAVRKSKRLIRADRPDVTVRMKAEEAVFMEQLRSREFAESLRAILEKREPEFE